MSIETAIALSAINGEKLSPKISVSRQYKHWVSLEDLRRCLKCAETHGKIWSMEEIPDPEPPLHPLCRCSIRPMNSITAGTATIRGTDGADFSLKYNGHLPDYYITEDELKELGWKKGDAVTSFIKGKLVTKGRYRNRNSHLPQVPGRIWYEADINYISGRRNSQRVVWSNDGLIFVTYDHYETFYEIV